MRVLFLCSKNKKRSLTAEVHFAIQNEFEVASAGLNRDSQTPVTPDLLTWADLIFVMEPVHRQKLSKRFNQYLKDTRIVCLDIADKYEFMDSDLIAELERKVRKHL
ncbi:low molecular weight protein tyrosine phosphatase family protein [Gimesia sp.]|uniref:low molecular weight protein tyrosine phosphatase family protein n=1 Tax=Gimesia sp. TaxID=2024833 RepID=UPI003A903DE5